MKINTNKKRQEVLKMEDVKILENQIKEEEKCYTLTNWYEDKNLVLVASSSHSTPSIHSFSSYFMVSRFSPCFPLLESSGSFFRFGHSDTLIFSRHGKDRGLPQITLQRLYEVVRREIWYRPDMFFYRDMLMMLARNKKVDETKKVWEDLKKEGVLFDQHTFGDLVRAFLDNELLLEAMRLYEEMRDSPDPPLSLPFRVILKGLVPYPELREKVKDDFLELLPGMIVYDPPEDLCEESDEEARTDSDLEY